MVTDSLVMSGPFERASTEVLRAMRAEAEAGQDSGAEVGFSTALTDAERRYLDLCAELFARGEYAAGRQPCEGEELAA